MPGLREKERNFDTADHVSRRFHTCTETRKRTIPRQDRVREIVHELIVLHRVVEVYHASVSMGMFDDADGLCMVPVDVVLQLPAQDLGLVQLRLRSQCLRRGTRPLPDDLFNITLPRFVATPLPLATGPLRDGDLEENVMRRSIMRHHGP